MKVFDIFCVSETKVSKGNDIPNFTTFNLEKRSNKYRLPGIHGLSVYISNKVAGCCTAITDLDFDCETAIWIKIAEKFILCSLYLPYEGSKHHYNELYDDLSTDISAIKHKFAIPIVLIGDFNSRVGNLNEVMLADWTDSILDESNFEYPDIIETLEKLDMPLTRRNVDGKINNNGKKLIEVCQLYELCILNGRTKSDKNIGKQTCADKSTIDFAICSPNILKNIEDFYIDDFDPLLSDKHSPVCISLYLGEPDTQIIDTPHPPDTSENDSSKRIKCKWDEQKKDEYKLNFDEQKINAIMQTLSTTVSNELTQTSLDNCTLAINEIFLEPAKATGMYNKTCVTKNKRRKKQNKPWFNEECLASKKKYKEHKNLSSKNPSDENKQKLNDLANCHKKTLRRVKRKYEKEFNIKLKLLKSKEPGEYWKLINPKNKSTKIGDISMQDFLAHFSELNTDISNISSERTDAHPFGINEIINNPFTYEEIHNLIRKLKKNKSPGIDLILNEFIKHCPENLIQVIVTLFNLVLESGIIPTDWTIGVIKPLYKNKGTIHNVNNYRGITLLSCLGKLFTSVINARLYAYLTFMNILGHEQVGFRSNHSTLDHILALQILINYYTHKKKQLYCAFVDYSKAFDFVNRTYLWQKLLQSNINGKIFNVIKNMYNNAKSQISVKNLLSESFPCQVGVRQGENLSPLLFALFLNDFKIFLSEKYNGLTKITDSVQNELNTYLYIFCLLYADDTLILAESREELQKALDGLYEYCNKWSLKVNLDKTNVIIFSRGIKPLLPFKFGDNTVNVVKEYVYLGTTFTFNGNFKEAKIKQAAQARKAAFNLLRRTREFNFSVEVFVELFERLVIPVLLYGSEIWGYGNTKILQQMCNKAMKQFLKLNVSTPTCMLIGELGLKYIDEYIDNRMLNFWCNIATSNEYKISNILYKWIKALYDQNSYKSLWLDKIHAILNKIGMSNLFIDNNIENVNKTWFKNTIKLKLNDIYKQTWSEEVFSNGICVNYRIMTGGKQLQEYLTKLPKPYMFSMVKFKTANHKMPIVKGRHLNIDYNERICTLCQLNQIGDEYHYLLVCPFFREKRIKYLKNYYFIRPNTLKFAQIFSISNYAEMLKAAKLIYEIIMYFRRE